MKLILKLLAGIAAVLLLAVVALNFLLSADSVRDRVASRVKEQTGRDLKVSGSSTLLFLPSPHIVLTEVSITDPENRAGADLAIDRLSLDVSFSQLFSRKVDAERVVMERPVLTVRLKSQTEGGQQGSLDERSRDFAATAPRFALAQAAGAGRVRRDVVLKDVRIEDGTVRIIYDGGGSERRIEHINANLRLPHLVEPLLAGGDFDWKGLRVGFDVKLATPADLGTERPARIEFGLNTDTIDADFGGYLATRPGPSLEGEFVAKTKSVPSVLAWLRQEPAVTSAIGDGEVSSHVAWNESEVAFTQTRFALSHAVGQGQGVISLTTPKPYLRAALAVEHLNLDPLFASNGAGGAAQPAPAAAPEAAPGPREEQMPWQGPPETAQQFTEAPPEAEAAEPAPSPEAPEAPEAPAAEPAPQAEAPSASGVVMPAAFDADANINIRELRWGKLVVGPSSLGLRLREGVLDTSLNSMQLYGGEGSGAFSLDGARPVPTFSGNLKLANVAAQPLLSAASGFNLLAGTAEVELDLKGQGGTPTEIKHSLGGSGSVEISDGAIVGLNITELIASLGAGRMPDLDQGPGAKTDFSGLGGTFRMASGVAESHDLEMVSPLLKVTARGTVDIVTGTLDFLTHPQIVAGPQGKEGANRLAGLSIPVRIEGPFARPSFRPEISGLVKGPGGGASTVNQIGEMLQRNLKGKPVGEAIGRILGSVKIGGQRDAEDGTGGPADENPQTAGEDDERPGRSAEPQEEAPAQEEEPSDPDLEEILR